MSRHWKCGLLVWLALAAVGSSQDEEYDDDDELLDTSPAWGSSEAGDHAVGLTKHQISELHSKMDKDKDGFLSMPEIADFAHFMRGVSADKENTSEAIEFYDTNKDGKVQLAEVADDFEDPVYKEDFTVRFKAADRNEDGILDAEEVKFFTHPELHDEVLYLVSQGIMKRLDKDGNGHLSALEFLEREEAPEGEEEQHQEEILESMPEEFHHLDKDEDGFLNATELRSWAGNVHYEEVAIKTFFVDSDQDEDGKISKEELEASWRHGLQPDISNHFETWASHMEL